MTLSKSSENVQNVAVLGATGSIGTATAEVIEHLECIDTDHQWRLWAASGHRNLGGLRRIVDSASRAPECLVLSDPDSANRSNKVDFSAHFKGRVKVGPDALVEIARAPQVGTVVAAIVGRAGLESTLAAVEAGKRVALANKETLVVAGSLVEQMMEKSGAELLPVDSEHSAIFQCLGSKSGQQDAKPKKLILTASGGPFRTWTADQMAAATPASALAHPTWEMGPKITVDSATMMNKALEIVEARWLFGLPAESIEVVIHPQSIIHSMVEFVDGSVIAQLSPPDMRLPIQYALTYPRRLACQSPSLDRQSSWDLTLEVADRERFPALELGFEVARVGGTAGAVVNAANEEAVGLFLDDQIRFTDIVPSCRKILDNHTFESHPPLQRLLELDRWARKEVRQRLKVV